MGGGGDFGLGSGSINYKNICNFKNVHILDSMYKCHYNVFMLQLCVSNYWQ